MRPSADDDAKFFARELRNGMTGHERAVWNEIRKRQTGVRFRRQVPIGPFIVDFACLNPKVIVEIDGSVHDWQDETRRTTFLESKGFTVLRFTNDDVEEGGVGEYIRWWMQDQGHISEEQE